MTKSGQLNIGNTTSGSAIDSPETSTPALDRPSLSIRLGNGFMELAWPTNSPGYQLQRAIHDPSGTWANVTNEPIIVGTEFRLHFIPGASPEFFRLKSPY